MFELLSDGQRLWLTLLLIVWAALLFGGFILGKTWTDGTRRMPVWTRMASSLTLVIAAWSLAIFTQGMDAAAYAVLIAIGMTLGFLGDLFMAKLIPVSWNVLGGMAAFGLGHVAYIIAIAWLGNTAGLDDSAARWGAWIAWLIVGALGWFVAVWRGARDRTALHSAALPYALLLASTAGAATGLALQTSLLVGLAVGAGLFLLSDLILAERLFRGVFFPLIDDVVWLTYGPAQMLIVYSINAALYTL